MEEQANAGEPKVAQNGEPAEVTVNPTQEVQEEEVLSVVDFAKPQEVPTDINGKQPDPPQPQKRVTFKEKVQPIIDLIPENKEDALSLRNMMRDTLSGFADLIDMTGKAVRGELTEADVTPEKMMQAALDMTPGAAAAGRATMKAGEATLGMFASSFGKRAKPELQQMLETRKARAQEMFDSGEDMNEIWRQTGLDKDPNGNWFFEVDPQGAKFKLENVRLESPELTKSWAKYGDDLSPYQVAEEEIKEKYQTSNLGTRAREEILARAEALAYREYDLGELVDFPDLFDNFDLDNVKIVSTYKTIGGSKMSAEGQYRSSDSLADPHVIAVNPDTLHKIRIASKDPAKAAEYQALKAALTNTVFHELQHHVQMEDYRKGINTYLGSSSTYVKSIMEKIAAIRSRSNLSFNDMMELAKYGDAVDALNEHYAKLTKKYANRNSVPAYADWIGYNNTPGEVQARLAGWAKTLSPENQRELMSIRPSERRKLMGEVEGPLVLKDKSGLKYHYDQEDVYIPEELMEKFDLSYGPFNTSKRFNTKFNTSKLFKPKLKPKKFNPDTDT